MSRVVEVRQNRAGWVFVTPALSLIAVFFFLPVLGGLVLYPLDQAGDMLRFYRDFCGTLPDEAEAYAALLTAPQGMPVGAMMLGYNGPIADGEKIFAHCAPCHSAVHVRCWHLAAEPASRRAFRCLGGSGPLTQRPDLQPVTRFGDFD